MKEYDFEPIRCLKTEAARLEQLAAVPGYTTDSLRFYPGSSARFGTHLKDPIGASATQPCALTDLAGIAVQSPYGNCLNLHINCCFSHEDSGNNIPTIVQTNLTICHENISALTELVGDFCLDLGICDPSSLFTRHAENPTHQGLMLTTTRPSSRLFQIVTQMPSSGLNPLFGALLPLDHLHKHHLSRTHKIAQKFVPISAQNLHEATHLELT